MSDGHLVEFARDGLEGSFLARNYDYEAIILDYSLPKKDGLAVCEEVRRAGKFTPIIFLSITDDTSVKVAAFKRGADDYVTKPFSIEELRARLNAITRRPNKVEKPLFQVADLILDAEKQTVYRGKDFIRLTRKEFNLIQYMMNNVGIILSRAMIMEHVWTADSDTLSNTIETHIRNIRKKIIGKNKSNLIINVQGRGYVIDTPENLKKLMAIR
jgi:two-component system, OmpR family, manganese sensing response regulator